MTIKYLDVIDDNNNYMYYILYQVNKIKEWMNAYDTGILIPTVIIFLEHLFNLNLK